MKDADSLRFFQCLMEMALMFCDDVTRDRQKLYWKALAPRLTIEEWEYACATAMDRETFHKVPLPAVLVAYAAEYRREQVQREKDLADSAAYRVAEARHLLAPPMPPEDVKSKLNVLLATVGETTAFPGTPPQPRPKAAAYRTPLEAWEYAERKTELLRQARLVEETMTEEEPLDDEAL